MAQDYAVCILRAYTYYAYNVKTIKNFQIERQNVVVIEC